MNQNPRLTRLRQPRSVRGDREGRIGSSWVSMIGVQVHSRLAPLTTRLPPSAFPPTRHLHLTPRRITPHHARDISPAHPSKFPQHAHHIRAPRAYPHARYLLNFAGAFFACSSTSAFRSSQRGPQTSPSSTCTSDSSARARSLHMRAMSVATHIG